MPLPDGIDPRELDSETRRQLMSLSKETAETVAQHLIMVGRLIDQDPEQALRHARAARALAGRIGPVREANGLAAYTAGEWAEALSELRAARRMTGQPDHLAVMADCERALGKPERALMVSEDPQAKDLDPAAKVELMIVTSGARRDLGQYGTAVALLQVPALEGPVRAWTARLRYAYADALLDDGREDEARLWFARAAEVDEHLETDAEDRLLELDGMVVQDLADEDVSHEADDDVSAEHETSDADDAAPAREVDATELPAAVGMLGDDSREVDTETPPTAGAASPQVSGGADPSPVVLEQGSHDAVPGLGSEIPALGAPLFREPEAPTGPPGDDALTLFD